MFGSFWCHSRPPVSPQTRMFRLFSSPTAICDAWRIPLAPLLNLSRMFPSSSRSLPSTNAVRSAASSLISRPVMYSARFSACVPMSPMHPAAPDRLGSVRQAACFWSESSSLVASHPCGYSTTIFLILPMWPLAMMCLACLTIG